MFTKKKYQTATFSLVTFSALAFACTVPAPSSTEELAFPDRQGVQRTATLLGSDGQPGGTIAYHLIDGVAVFEGDILIHLDDLGNAAFQRRALPSPKDQGEQDKAAGRTTAGKLWTDNIVYYEIDSGLSDQSRVTDAIAEMESETNLVFLERSDQDDYIYFTTGSGCSSYIGRQGGMQEIWLSSSCSTGNAIHEIGHAIGLYHEHTRADRDSYVTIEWGDIKSGYSGNFEQYTASDGADLTDYDPDSIMHYGCWAFTTGTYGNSGSRTIVPDDSDWCDRFGQRDGLSDLDIEGIDVNYPSLRMYMVNYKGSNGQGTHLADLNGQGDTGSSSGIWRDHTCASDIEIDNDHDMFAVSCQGYGAGAYLYRMDKLTARTDRVGLFDGGLKVTNLAVDPTTNTLYAIDHQGNGWGTRLLTLNKNNANHTVIGTLHGDRTHATSIAFDSNGTLYAINNQYTGGSGSGLYTIDTTTAETTDVSWLNGDRTHATSIRFTDNDTLLGINWNGGGGAGRVLFVIDPDDGSTDDIAWLSGDHTHAVSFAIY